MTARRLGVTLLIVMGLVASVVVVEIILPRQRAERESRERVLLSPGAELGAFSIARDGASWTFTPREEGGWRLDVEGLPKPLEADVRVMAEVRHALSGFGGIRGILADDISAVADRAQFGVEPARLRLAWTDDRARPRSLVIGAHLAENQVAALLDDRRLVLLPREVRDAVDRDLDIFRNKSLINLQWKDIVRLAIARGGVIPAGVSPRIVVERSDSDAWRLIEPVARDANPVRMESLVSKLAALSAGDFGAETPTAADRAAAGLSPPVASLSIGLASGAAINVEFGTDASETLAWARVDDGPLVAVRADLRADVLLPDEYFRDNRPVRLPRWAIVNLRMSKGTGEDVLELEVQRDEKDGWDIVKPAGGALEPSEAELLLDLLEGVQCGRFEDSLAATPGAADARWDFSGPGALRIRASALLSGGRPRHVDLDAVPFLHQRMTYHAVRTIDQDGREEVCVAGIKAFDPLVERVRAILARR